MDERLTNTHAPNGIQTSDPCAGAATGIGRDNQPSYDETSQQQRPGGQLMSWLQCEGCNVWESWLHAAGPSGWTADWQGGGTEENQRDG
jgi:hypothetical protein